jgi:OmpA-OmpF porin, OOP family
LGKFLKSHKNINIEISGHTDNIGDQGALKQLSLDRANVIKDILIKQGIDASRIFTSGKGDTEPLFDNITEASRKQNRRVEIRIVKD